MYRQGDILFIPLKGEIGEIRKRYASGIIAKGEATGHVHRVADVEKAEVVEAEVDGRTLPLVHVHNPVQIVHDEHGPLDLPAGDYEIRRQREWDLRHTWTAVRD